MEKELIEKERTMSRLEELIDLFEDTNQYNLGLKHIDLAQNKLNIN